MIKQRSMVLAAFFAALLSISSYIVIPIGPVPHSIQPLFVFLNALILGAKTGCVSVLVWFALGIIGLPVFAGGKAGLTTFIEPTGGFLLGFLVATYVIGSLSDKGTKSFGQTFMMIMPGLIIIYTLGLIGFKLSMEYVLNKNLSWQTSFGLVVVPFLPFDVVKAIVATYLGLKIKKALFYFER